MDEKEFEKAVEEWIGYCKTPKVIYSSNPKTITKCDAYEKIGYMDYDALSLIRKLYDKNNSNNFALSIIQEHGLVQLVKEIIGDDFKIPKEIQGRIKKMEKYTKNWLDKNMNKYFS